MGAIIQLIVKALYTEVGPYIIESHTPLVDLGTKITMLPICTTVSATEVCNEKSSIEDHIEDQIFIK